MVVTFYQLKKRPNSTKTVDKTSQYWFSVNVELKDPCNTIEPSFTLELLPGSNNKPFVFPANIIESGGVDDGLPADLTSYTHVDMCNLYFRCPIFRITDIEIENTIATVHLRADLLASYRDEILNSTQFIGRISDVLKCDRTQIDTLPITENRYRFDYAASGSDVFQSGYESGSYVLGVINDSPKVGSVCYYLFQNLDALTELLSYLMSGVEWLNISDISDELTKSLINPMQYIVSCKYFPLNIDYYEANNEILYDNVKVGYWETPVKALKMLDFSTSIIGTVPVSGHPQAQHNNDYLLLPPYTTRTFYLEPFGAIPLDGSFLMGGEKLAYKIIVDHISGAGMLYLYRMSSTNDFISVHYANVAQDIKISQLTTDVLRVAENALNTAVHAGDALMTLTPKSLADATSAAAECFRSTFPQVRSCAGNAYTPFIGGPAKIFTKCVYIDESFNDEYGYIHNARRGLSTCIGDWVQCPHPQLELVATEENVQKIYSLLKEGVYLE